MLDKTPSPIDSTLHGLAPRLQLIQDRVLAALQAASAPEHGAAIPTPRTRKGVKLTGRHRLTRLPAHIADGYLDVRPPQIRQTYTRHRHSWLFNLHSTNRDRFFEVSRDFFF